MTINYILKKYICYEVFIGIAGYYFILLKDND